MTSLKGILVTVALCCIYRCCGGVPTNVFLGVGYNLLKANPDGGEWSSLGQDPGLLVTRVILQNEIYGRSLIQTTNYPRCNQILSTSVFYDPKSYQEYLRHYITVDETTVSNVSRYSFTDSQLYRDITEKMKYNHDVYRDEISTCPSIHARYNLPFGPIAKNLVTPEFARDVCRLPEAFDPQQYHYFLDTWGTHVTMEVEMGQKSNTRYRLSVANLAEVLLLSHDSDVAFMTVEDFEGYGTVVHLNMSHIHQTDFTKLPLGKQVSHFSIGAVTEAALSWTLAPITRVLTSDYWQNIEEFYRNGICNSETTNLTNLRLNLEKAVESYPGSGRGEIPKSMDIKLPVTWPNGTYGLYMANTGCPKDPLGFSSGYFTEYTESYKNQNDWTTGIHLEGQFDHFYITTHFCMKVLSTTNEYRREWQRGNYCILKKGVCPKGFQTGYLTMDDEDDYRGNRNGGSLPDGQYFNGNTIYYCCRNDSSAHLPILMPIDKPFYLLRYTGPCQEVLGMTASEEFVLYDNEDSNNGNECSGAHPLIEGRCKYGDLKIHFCYYQRHNHTSSTISMSGILG